MSHVFISYSHEDRDYTDRLVADLLQHGFDVWIDDRIDYGKRWWQVIVQAIRDCGAFIVVMSPDAERSEWVEREVMLAQDEEKTIFPLLLQGKRFPLLITTQYADVRGEKLPPGDFYAGLARVLTPAQHTGQIVTPPHVERKVVGSPRFWAVAAGIVAVIALAIIVLAAINPEASSGTPTEGAVLPTTVAASPTETPTQTVPPSETQVETPHPLTEIAQRLTEAVGTATAWANETAAAWTDMPTSTSTPTPDWTATYHAFETLVAPTLVTWTPTATSTSTNTLTPTFTATFTPTNTTTPTVAPTLPPREAALQRAYAFQGNNDDWEPYTEIFVFDGGFTVELVLVPKGCFLEEPENIQCFDVPFWIGRYEITNVQYQNCVNAGECQPNGDYGAAFNGADNPVTGVSLYDAQDFVDWLAISADLPFQLPSEIAWEYAARGPDGWLYPWGNDFDRERLNFCDLSCGERWGDVVYNDGYARTSPVGAFSPVGDSWVGAADMAGNIAEWIINDPLRTSVMKGGAWWSNQWSTRLISYGDGNLDTQSNIVGFRIMIVSIEQ